MNEDRAQELRQILAGSGSVTFIKSGQALSLRGDLVKNREYVRELTKLQVRKQRWGVFVCSLLGMDGMREECVRLAMMSSCVAGALGNDLTGFDLATRKAHVFYATDMLYLIYL